jgi:hypothetical protein
VYPFWTYSVPPGGRVPPVGKHCFTLINVHVCKTYAHYSTCMYNIFTVHCFLSWLYLTQHNTTQHNTRVFSEHRNRARQTCRSTFCTDVTSVTFAQRYVPYLRNSCPVQCEHILRTVLVYLWVSHDVLSLWLKKSGVSLYCCQYGSPDGRVVIPLLSGNLNDHIIIENYLLPVG